MLESIFAPWGVVKGEHILVCGLSLSQNAIEILFIDSKCINDIKHAHSSKMSLSISQRCRERWIPRCSYILLCDKQARCDFDAKFIDVFIIHVKNCQWKCAPARGEQAHHHERHKRIEGPCSGVEFLPCFVKGKIWGMVQKFGHIPLILKRTTQKCLKMQLQAAAVVKLWTDLGW